MLAGSLHTASLHLQAMPPLQVGKFKAQQPPDAVRRSSQHCICSALQVAKLKEVGVEKVVCIAVDEPEAVADWATKVGLADSEIETWADTKGAWTRMLGLDMGPPEESSGPKSQR